MRTRSRMLVVVSSAMCIALALAIVSSTRSFAQEKKEGAMMTPEQQREMEEAMMKAGMPGDEHKEMAKSAGAWDAEIKFLDMASGEWSKPVKGVMRIEPMFDGRYMMMKYEGVMDMGGQTMPFQGLGIMGYDNAKKKYFSTWFDSMSTGMMHTEGTRLGNVTTLTGSMTDPATGKDVMCKEVATHPDDNHMTYEMFCDMGGKEMKMMEIKYTRKK